MCVRQVVLSFCYRVMMQGSNNVSNVVRRARIKKEAATKISFGYRFRKVVRLPGDKELELVVTTRQRQRHIY